MAELPKKFIQAKVARLATVTTDNKPHLVPVVFAIHQDAIVTAIDGKPKSTTRLKRLENIQNNPQVSLLVDHYDDDWTQLWWIRVDGRATITDNTDALHELEVKYQQYQQVSLDGPVINISVESIKTWGLGLM